MPSACVVLLIGSQAAGKSTVARLVADRFDRSAVVDLPMHRVVHSGRVGPTGDREAFLTQLRLRYRAQASVVREYWAAGYTTVWTEVVFDEELLHIRSLLRDVPLVVVALTPRPDVVAAREAGRTGDAYRDWEGISVEQVAQEWDDALGRTRGIDLRVDNSEEAPLETAERIVRWIGTADCRRGGQPLFGGPGCAASGP